MAENTELIVDDGGHVRSPRYPAISLPAAVVKVKALYDADKTAGTPMQAVWGHLGYKSKSGPAAGALAALKRFGLAEVKSGRVYPTKRAIAIICLPKGDKRRDEALRDAVMSPDLYANLVEMYRESGLPSVESLQHELLMGGDFNHNAVPGLVRDFVASLEFAGLSVDGGLQSIEDEGNEESEEEDETEEDEERQNLVHVQLPSKTPKTPAVTVLPEGMRDFPLYTPSHRGALYVPSKMSKSDFDLLKQQIDAYLLVIKATSIIEGDAAGAAEST
jgi:hypothetical protein